MLCDWDAEDPYAGVCHCEWQLAKIANTLGLSPRGGVSQPQQGSKPPIDTALAALLSPRRPVSYAGSPSGTTPGPVRPLENGYRLELQRSIHHSTHNTAVYVILLKGIAHAHIPPMLPRAGARGRRDKVAGAASGQRGLPRALSVSTPLPKEPTQ